MRRPMLLRQRRRESLNLQTATFHSQATLQSTRHQHRTPLPESQHLGRITSHPDPTLIMDLPHQTSMLPLPQPLLMSPLHRTAMLRRQRVQYISLAPHDYRTALPECYQILTVQQCHGVRLLPRGTRQNLLLMLHLSTGPGHLAHFMSPPPPRPGVESTRHLRLRHAPNNSLQ